MSERQGRRVLLFSGGMDSLIATHLFKPDIRLYLKTGSRYDAAQLERLDQARWSKDLFGRLIVDDGLRLGEYERDDSIVPGRNAFFVLRAANYGTDILLGAMSGERQYDKSKTFERRMNRLLAQLWHPDQYWTDDDPPTVSRPLAVWTKTMALREYLNADGDPSIIAESYSCYSGNDQPCGACRSCGRKWVAFVNNGIENLLPFDIDVDAIWSERELRLMARGEYRGVGEDTETLEALEASR